MSKRLRLITACVLWCLSVLVPVLAARPAHAHEIIAGDLQILHPHVFEPGDPPRAELPDYMVIRNVGTSGDRMLAATTPFAAKVDIVTHALAGQTSVAGVALPPNAETVVGPRAAFLSMRTVIEPLAGYQYFPMTLIFEKAGKVEIEVFVEDTPEPTVNSVPLH